MGCNGSKNQDIKDSRQRVKQTTANSNQATPSKTTGDPNATSPPLSTGKKSNVENVAESYTDLRMKENEMFQKIINKTAHNFIDIAQSPSMMQQHGMNIHDHFHHHHHHHHHHPQHHYDSFDNHQHSPLPPSQQYYQQQGGKEEGEDIDTILNRYINNIHLFGLPIPNTRINSRQTIANSSITEEDIENISAIADMITHVRESMKINDENIPPLVVQLPEIDSI
jgi:ABC-type Zn2+ transport system substrate-binding protein/surface adhesin